MLLIGQILVCKISKYKSMAGDFFVNIALYFYEKFVISLVEYLWNKFEPHHDTTKKVAVGILVAVNVICISTCLSSFLFGSFYYSQMPKIYHTFPLNFVYNRSCMENHKFYATHSKWLSKSLYMDECYPTAQFRLSAPNDQSLLKEDQFYSFVFNMEIPETSSNFDIGMFMIKMYVKGHVSDSSKLFKVRTDIDDDEIPKNTWFYGKNKVPEEIVYQSFISTSLKYKSQIIRLIKTVAFWPLYVMDVKDEVQHVEVVLFEELLLPQKKMQWTGKILIDHPAIMINSAYVDVTAKFKGIQYLMYKWPALSFLFGTFLFFMPVFFLVTMLVYFCIWRRLFPQVNTTPVTRTRHTRRVQRLAQIDPAASISNQDPSVSSNQQTFTQQGSSSRRSSSSSSIEMIGQSQGSPIEETQGSFILTPPTGQNDVQQIECSRSTVAVDVNNLNTDDQLRQRRIADPQEPDSTM